MNGLVIKVPTKVNSTTNQNTKVSRGNPVVYLKKQISDITCATIVRTGTFTYCTTHTETWEGSLKENISIHSLSITLPWSCH